MDAVESNRDPMAAYWMPFTAGAAFRADPKLFVAAEGMHYVAVDGRRVLDAMAGLWCVNAGHGQVRIADAIADQARRLDFVSSFSMGHPGAFALADRLAAMAPGDLDRVFFTNSGSESIDTALKMARAYHRARGEPGRVRFIGRARSYHGMGWGGLSVSGIGRHKRDFGPLLGEVSHLPHTHDLEHNAFSVGQPAWGAHLADALEGLVQTYEPSTVAAVIVEPVAGSGGVLPPPVGYLERLRAICDAHGILLIFDEVITGFGRLGAGFAAEAFGVMPDMIACAKGMTNGAVPMGGVIVREPVHAAIAAAAAGGPELFHGYTYSGHPLACAAGIAALDVYAEQDLFARAAAMAPVWAAAAHGLRGLPHVTDIRTIGLLAAIDLAPRAGGRAAACAQHCYGAGVLIRGSGDTIVLSPPLVISAAEIDQVFAAVRAGILAGA